MSGRSLRSIESIAAAATSARITMPAPPPADRSAALLQILGADGRLAAFWQLAPADPLRQAQPDLTIGRVGRQQAIRSGEVVAFQPGDFVRIALRAQIAAGEPALAVQIRLVGR
jgi:hypothetical protein